MDGRVAVGLLVVLAVYAYLTYMRKFRHYIYHQINDIKNGNRPRGKCPPFYPNGWYKFMNSDELAVNEVKSFDYCGRDITFFRGTDRIVYAVHSYCPHMSANLGKGGVVKNTNCIQCPFHGWVFHGQTGDCVQSGESLAKKLVEQYEYGQDIKTHARNEDGTYLVKCNTGYVSLKTYQVREIKGSIYVLIESRGEDKVTQPYPYEPFDIPRNGLSYRGESINYVNCHVQEIPENGADIRHFDFLHTKFMTNFITFDWTMKSERASSKQLLDIMQHERAFINKFKMNVLDKFLNDANRPYVNIISLDCYMKIFNWKFFFFNATGFQVGPGLVYLFLKSKFFDVLFEQSILPMKKFEIRVCHKIFTSSYLPYWLSAFMLYSEVQQLLSDMTVWNNKVM